MGELIFMIFFSIPEGVIALFVVCLVRYLLAKNRNCTEPGSVSEQQLNKRKLFAIVTGVIAGVLLTVFVGIIILFFMSLAYM